MAEPIKAKLVLDTSSMKNAAAGFGSGGSIKDTVGKGIRDALEGLDTQILGDIGAALAGGVLVLEKVFETIKKGFGFLVQSSPLLASSINILTKSMQVLLRPIGDAIGLFIKPFAIAMLRFAIPIYKKWREFLGSDSATSGLSSITEGASSVAAGVITLDFDLVKDGLSDIWTGLTTLSGGFLDFLDTNLVDIWSKMGDFVTEGWAYFVETFGVVSEWISEKLNIGLSWAWDKFWAVIGGLGDDDWKESMSGLKGGLESIWAGFMDIVQAYDKYGIVFAPIILALESLFGAMDFTPMMDNLKSKFEEEFPSIAAIINSGEDEDGLLSTLWSVLTKVGEYLSVDFTEAFSGIKRLAELMFTEEIPAALKETDGSLNTSATMADLLSAALLLIPTQIVTTHIIRTVFETVEE